jgi:lysine 6-dehydrogenase
MNSYAVIGAGMMGRVIAKDLLETEPDCRVTLLDVSAETLAGVRSHPRHLPADRVTTGILNVRDLDETSEALRGHTVAIGALPHAFALDALKGAVRAGVSMVDLVGSKPELRRELDAEAREAGVLILPGFGVAPGLSNVLIARGMERVDEPHTGVIYVGGIPVERTPPLEYQTVYSLVSMFGAYLRPAQIWQDGGWTTVPPLTGLETLEFPSIGPLEAFYTDGLASLAITMTGKFRDSLEEKTMRYPGFAQKVAFLNDCGLLSADPVEVGGVEVAPRDVLIKQVGPLFELGPKGDILVMRVVVTGAVDGREVVHTFELVDYQDEVTGDTAMARTTGFPAAIAARMISSGDISEPGVAFPEEMFGGARGDHLLSELAARGVKVDHREA